jgi:3-hydroxyacyl-CoA dehydrogenase
MTSKIQIHHDADVMVITVNNPPINAGSTEVRKGLLDAIHLFQNDTNLAAAVIIGGGSTFIAGSDIKEFSQPLAEPHLPSVIAAIEGSLAGACGYCVRMCMRRGLGKWAGYCACDY